jgi:hypothetical protein
LVKQSTVKVQLMRARAQFRRHYQRLLNEEQRSSGTASSHCGSGRQPSDTILAWEYTRREKP